MNRETLVRRGRPQLFYEIRDWTAWDRTVNESAKEFFIVHQVWPDRLIANVKTLEKMDRAGEATAKRGSGFLGATGCPENEDGEDEEGIILITRFVGRNYFLDMYFDEIVPDNAFLLARESQGEAPGIGWN